ncbi:4Fe-4S binding protein [Petrotoga halophila]|uniref:Dihydrothymine dehydrogenase n=1 Tax=Petrotoga halophila DSM 16923 TaxID=1122953 RepID=A0A2S5EE14_9BACT|nr:4Fe-4S binding protein [Petrotoga halophila]POZ91238.1 diguanylate cyclase [Petrotoga halophila DSM 16923]
MANISVNLLRMLLKNPVMPAAGPPIRNGEAAHRAKEGGAGAIVTKTVSVEAAKVPKPNMAQVKGGFINTELWSELPLEKWIEKEYPKVVETGLPVIIGVGYTAEEIREVIPRIEKFADCFELSTHYLGSDPTPMINSIKAAKESTNLPVMVKLSPQIDIPTFSKEAEKAGADGIVLINSFGPTLDIDLETGRALLGSKNGYGWLSGQAIFPLALKSVFEAVKSVNIPVIGVGGISTAKEAIKMIMAGAQAVQVCTAAILNGPQIYGKISKGIEEFLDSHGYNSLDEIRGIAQQNIIDHPRYELVIPKVDDEKCTECGLCLKSCVYDAIHLVKSLHSVRIDEDKCEGCGLCVSRCNFNALTI